jgi:hypothetical protein
MKEKEEEWQTQGKFVPHPKLFELMKKTQILIELENKLMTQVKETLVDHQKGKDGGRTS